MTRLHWPSKRARRSTTLVLGVVALASVTATGADARKAHGAGGDTVTPIKHVIVIIGENHTFDNVFATYKPPKGEQVKNLLSEGIVTASGGPGPNIGKALQNTADNRTSYTIDPKRSGSYNTLPQPNTTYVSKACDGQDENVPDTRFPSDLANAPYQITKYVPYFDTHSQFAANGTCEFIGPMVGDPIHRFYQMWQQVSTNTNDLWTWVGETAGFSNGDPPPSPFTDQSTQQGGLSMGFYNMAAGDEPTLKKLAQHYSMSDNFHQSVMGGTGANHITLGSGDAAFYQDANGHATKPPPGEIENPDPQPGTNNFFTEDGYGKSGTTNGGSYSNCSDHSAPGVKGVLAYLNSLDYKVWDNCAPDHYYLLNNYNPGYKTDGTLNTSTFTVPPQHSLPTIGDELSDHGISWGYFGEGFNNGTPGPNYCGICDPMQYSSSIMTNPALRKNVQHDVGDFDRDVANGSLPAVTFLKPGDDDGHPAYSTMPAFEQFVSHAVDQVQSNPDLWKSTAIVVTMDEGGGYYDSGYVQPVSFFGDGPRIPTIVVSPWSKPGHISHTYTDHVSILKFIERNWRLPTLSARSLDNLPDPKTNQKNPYVPVNKPSIGDLFDYFDFHHPSAARVKTKARRAAVAGARPARVSDLAH